MFVEHTFQSRTACTRDSTRTIGFELFFSLTQLVDIFIYMMQTLVYLLQTFTIIQHG